MAARDEGAAARPLDDTNLTERDERILECGDGVPVSVRLEKK